MLFFVQSLDKPTRYYSKKQETRVSKNLGLRVQSNSGATAFQKGDLKDDHILVECKTAVKPQKQRTIEKEWLTKLKEEQVSMRKPLSALVFDFGDGDDYVILTKRDFRNLYEAWKEIMEQG